MTAFCAKEDPPETELSVDVFESVDKDNMDATKAKKISTKDFLIEFDKLSEFAILNRTFFSDLIEKGMGKFANFVSRFRFFVLLFSLGFAAVCANGFRELSINTEQELFIPLGSESLGNVMDMSYTFLLGPIPSLSEILVVAEGDTNILEKEQLRKIWEIDQAVREAGTDAIIDLMYEDVCLKSFSLEEDGVTAHCKAMGFLNFWNSDFELYLSTVRNDSDVIAAVNSPEYPNGAPVWPKHVLGGIECDAESGRILRAKSVLLQYPTYFQSGAYGKVELLGVRKGTANWEMAFWNLDILQKGEYEGLKIYHNNRRNEKQHQEDAQADLMSKILISGLLIMVVSALAAMSLKNRLIKRKRHLHWLLGILGILSTLLSVVCGFGICFYFEVPCSLLNLILPPLIFGIGADDMFVLISHFEGTDPNSSSHERAQKTLEECAPALMFAFLSSVLAFGLGIMGNTPAMRTFSIYAVVCLVLDLLYQLTFFLSLLLIFDEIERYGFHYCFARQAKKNKLEIDAEMEEEMQKRKAHQTRRSSQRSLVVLLWQAREHASEKENNSQKKGSFEENAMAESSKDIPQTECQPTDIADQKQSEKKDSVEENAVGECSKNLFQTKCQPPDIADQKHSEALAKEISDEEHRTSNFRRKFSAEVMSFKHASDLRRSLSAVANSLKKKYSSEGIVTEERPKGFSQKELQPTEIITDQHQLEIAEFEKDLRSAWLGKNSSKSRGASKFAEKMIRLLMSKTGCCLIVLFVLAYWAFIGIATVKLQDEFDKTIFFPYNSQGSRFVRRSKEVGLYPLTNSFEVNVIFENLNFKDPDVQTKILGFEQALITNGYFAGPFNSIFTFLSQKKEEVANLYDREVDDIIVLIAYSLLDTKFFRFIDDIATEDFQQLDDLEPSDPFFQQLFGTETSEHDSQPSELNFTQVFSELTTLEHWGKEKNLSSNDFNNITEIPQLDISALRTQVSFTDMSTTNTQRRAIKKISSMIEEYFGKDANVYAVDNHFVFMFLDILDGLRLTMISSMGFGLLCLLILSLLFTGSMHQSAVICLLLVVVDFCVYALPYILGFKSNLASYMVIAIAFGLVVNYFVHFISTYEHICKQFRESSASIVAIEMTMVKVGPAMILVSLTSAMSVVPLLFSKAPLGRILSQVYMLITLTGLIHGLVILPVFLSIGSKMKRWLKGHCR